MSDTQKHTKPNVPNLRFPGFEGEWERCTLGEIGSPYNGLTGKSGDDFGSGSPYITYKSIFDDTRIDLSRCEFVKISEQERKTQNQVRKGDIFFTISSETPDEVGMSSVLLDDVNDCYLNSFCFGFRLNVTTALTEFLRFYLRSKTIRKKISILAQGSTRYNISKGEIMKMPLRLPFPQEQKKIAESFSLIEERISIQNKVIEKYESLIKALRHHIFSTIETEKEVTIADVLSYEQPTEYIVSDTEYSDNKDLTPVLTANKAFILGYTEEIDGIYDKGPCIILDDFTLDSKIVDFPFKVKSSAIKILSAKSTVSLRYIFEYLKFLDLNTEEHKRHYIAEIEPMTIELPDEDSIQSIASLFDRMDQRRKGLERGLQLLRSQKEYLLRALFI
ncbi:MAG: restriction endonuclease subunit S [Bacteroidales bacterium]|nr:restriction endonuclease subunit S [Bacteroidales bacterium]